ncbi:chromosomal replication initiator protein DnaA [Blastopirellula sediminis]|nr:hypothetical protein [Blastopirellula sediminis]MCC9608277.1 hypothetical protein [Blastopirellula sediminis]
MKRILFFVLVGLATSLMVVTDSFARGGRGGGGGGRGGGGFSGGGGGYRGGSSVSRSPAVSRPASRPSVSRPSTPSVSRPSTSRPSVSNPSIGSSRPGGSRPGGATPSTRPGNVAGSRPGGVTGGARPSHNDLQNFLGLSPSTGNRPSTLPSGSRPSTRPGNVAAGIAGGAAGSAAADFLRDSGARPSTLPAQRPGGGDRPGIADRPGAGDRPGPGDRPGVGDRPGAGDRPGIADRPGPGNRPIADNRPNRIENRGDRQEIRQDRRNEIRDHVHDHPIRDFWSDHPLWGAWAITRPFRWAAWSGVAGWGNYGWSEPYYYNYGENVYYDDGQVYYGDDPICTEAEYAAQAEAIAASAPETPPEQSEWMSLGVFALTPDGQEDAPDPTLFLQLVLSKEGIISGTLNNTVTSQTQTIEGMVDKKSQRCAWNVVGKTRPIMECGISNLTQDTAPTLVHFADGTTQQWLMVRLDDPQGQNP